MPVPFPPRMKLGLTMIGNPMSAAISSASCSEWANPERGTSRPISSMAALKRSLSSAVEFASGHAPDHLHPVALQHAEFDQLHGQVECRLPAERRQRRVRPFLLDDGRQHLGVERLDVGPVRRRRVRHDGGRIRVGQDHTVALLRAGPGRPACPVVELAGLTDHDRPGSDDEDRLQVVATRGISASRCRRRRRPNGWGGPA